MKKILPNNDKTCLYLESLPKVYIVVQYAKWCVRSFPFSGKFKTGEGNIPIPLVYQYDDCNGCCDNFFLRPLNIVTSGGIADWTFNAKAAKNLEKYLNK